jgi:hypothetical protein
MTNPRFYRERHLPRVEPIFGVERTKVLAVLAPSLPSLQVSPDVRRAEKLVQRCTANSPWSVEIYAARCRGRCQPAHGAVSVFPLDINCKLISST